VVGTLSALSVVIAVLLLVWDNPMPVGTPGFWIIARMRVVDVAVIAVVVLCHAVATVSFQTVVGNRIITPSIMGFEALYRLVQTGAIFLFSATAVVALDGVWQHLALIAVMVAFASALYGWLLSGRLGNLHVMLLVGIILGAGLNGISTFMQRTLTPSEFDVLTSQLIGSLANADATYLVVSAPLALTAAGLLWWWAPVLDVMALGRDTAINLGLAHRRRMMLVLLLVAVLIAVSTSLVGPMTFLGFLVAMLAYQLADTYDHRRVFAVAVLAGFVVLAGAYAVLKHVFYAAGSVNVVVEIVGGVVFLVYVLRKGRL
jgi:iron complex transport system permease protein